MIKGNYCLYLYFGSNVWGDVDILIASSDIYNRQNIYSVIASFQFRVPEKIDINSVIHRFPISGNSFLPNERDFADVANVKKRNDSICTAVQHKNQIELSKKEKTIAKKTKNTYFFNLT